jgi:hypothetical protein
MIGHSRESGEVEESLLLQEIPSTSSGQALRLRNSSRIVGDAGRIAPLRMTF